MESMMLDQDEPMAVVAPDLTSDLNVQAAHVPVTVDSPAGKTNGTSTGANGTGHAHTNGNGNGSVKKEEEEDEEMPLARKPAQTKRAVNSGSSSEEDERPLAKKPRGSGGGGAGGRRRIVDSESEEEDVPVKKEKVVKPRPSGATTARPKTKNESSGSDSSVSSEDEKPLAKKSTSNGTAPANGNGNDKGNASASSSTSKAKSTKSASSASTSAKKRGSSSEEDEKPLAKKANGTNGDTSASTKSKSAAAAKAAAAKKRREDEEESDSPSSESDLSESSSEASSEDEKPLAKKKGAAAKKAPAKKAAAGSASAKSSGSRSATGTPRKGMAAAKANGGVKKEEGSSEEDEVPLAKSAKGKGKGKAVDGKGGKVKKEKVKKEEDGDEAEDGKYQWWEDAENDGSTKWKTLVHNGVLFPPAYIPLPKGVKMRYDGTSLTLPPESEEVAGFWAAMLETDHVQDATFQSNFFRDFQTILKKYPPREGIKVETLEKCDFRPMFEHFEKEKEKKKSMTKDEKKQIKADRDALEAPYLYAIVDGRKEKLGNFRAEPPGLFRGRGEHPRKGTLKFRLRPEDITLNIGTDAPAPKPNIPGKWKLIKHDPTVTWLAEWKENVNNSTKYVFLSAASSWKGQSDRSKFEKARQLIKHVDSIRKTYNADMKSKVMADRQRATALYFIDELALRAGNEKGEDEADTVGCCSLRYEHVTLEPPNRVTFDFLGKDSMRFLNTVEVQPQVFKNVKIFKADKEKGDQLFDRLTTGILNKYLNDFMPGLSAKVFRTYNASWTFQQQLRKLTPADGSVAEKIAAYNDANRDVAILCNHQKTVAKNFAESFAKMGDKVRALKYQRMKLRFQLFTLDPKAKKRNPELADDESDMDDDFMERHEADLLEKALESAKKKFERENLKLEEAKEDKKPKTDLEERLKEIKKEMKELTKERKSKKVESRKGATEEKLLDQITKMDARIAVAKTQMGDRDKTKDVALGTSKINYIDPRLTVAWAKKFDVPLEKLFSKTLREKFPWAEAEADEDWVF